MPWKFDDIPVNILNSYLLIQWNLMYLKKWYGNKLIFCLKEARSGLEKVDE